MIIMELLTLFAFFAVAYSSNAASPSLQMDANPSEDEGFKSRNLLADTEEPAKPAALNLYYLPTAGMIYTKTPPILKALQTTGNNTEYKLTPLIDTITQQEKSIVVIMSDKSVTDENRFRLSFTFAVQEGAGTWSLDSIKCQNTSPSKPGKEEILKSTTPITTSLGFSFHTPSKVVFNSESYELILNSLQVEYFNGKEHPKRFSVADDTVYFFTIPILSGLFVTSLLVTIVLLGLSMIYDIKTMDLFDDPKGKTVTINASE